MKGYKLKKRNIFIKGIILFGVLCIFFFCYFFNIIPHKQYTNRDFNIADIKSQVDQDQDGIDDQTDILISAREYLSTNPKYKSKYYGFGYPDDGYGVCTDVVAYALLGAGYDLMELVHEDILAHRDQYKIEIIDKNIDFRRVRNLKIFFGNHFVSLTTDLSKIDQWQGGDIVVFNDYVGIVSDKRNRKGIPFLIHHANPYQFRYEEDILEFMEGDIVGHYRVN